MKVLTYEHPIYTWEEKQSDDKWSEKACDRFAELTWLADWKILAAEVRGYKERSTTYGGSRREGSPIPSLELYDRNDNMNINIGEELIKEGYAQPEEISIGSQPKSKTKESLNSIEMVDIVTPVKNKTREFINKERIMSPDDGSGDHMRNGKEESPLRCDSSKLNAPSTVFVAPAGYESELSDDSGGFELG